MSKTIIVIICISIILAAWVLWSLNADKNIEQPAYTVIDRYPDFEVRQYQPHVIATVAANSNGRDGSDFMILARYIFGGNQGQQPIAMTAPVIMDKGQNPAMAFVLPGQYTDASVAPLPNNDAVQLKNQPAATYAVKRFTGFVYKQKTDRLQQRLQQAASQQQVQLVPGSLQVLRYDRPFVFFWLRRNEVRFKVVPATS